MIEQKERPCVYVLKNIWDEYYVGSTRNLTNRMYSHKSSNDKHDMDIFQVTYYDEDITSDELHIHEAEKIRELRNEELFLINRNKPSHTGDNEFDLIDWWNDEDIDFDTAEYEARYFEEV